MTCASRAIAWRRNSLARWLSLAFKMTYVAFTAIGNLVLWESFRGTPSWAIGAVSGFLVMTTVLSKATFVLLAVSYAVSLNESWRPGVIEVVGDRFLLRRGKQRLDLPRSELVGALIVVRPMGTMPSPTVEIELGNGDRITLRAATREEAHALVRSLGFDVAASRSRLALPARRLLHLPLAAVAFFVTWIVLLAARTFGDPVAGFAGLASATLEPIVPLLAFLVLRAAARPPEATVGADGVTVTHGLGRTQSVRLDEELGIAKALRGRLLDRVRIAEVGRAIEARRTARAVVPARMAAYERGTQSIAEWRESLRRVIEHGAYREAASPVDEAALVLRSPDATAEQRVGAALALRVAGEGHRVRVVAEAFADPDLRRALGAVTEDDDAEVARRMRFRRRR